MPVTATELITDAYNDLGIIQPGESVPTEDLAPALRRLNRFVSQLRTRSLTALAVERDVFPLTTNVATYTIGPGGDFDVERPLMVSGAGLLLNGFSAARTVTITRSGTIATVALTSNGFAVGDSVLILGATQLEYNGLQTVTSAVTDSFTYDVFGAPLTPATGTITAALEAVNAIEIPRSVITDDMYQGIQIKTLANALFTSVYFNPTQPLGTIWLWPTPNTNLHQLVLYLQTQFTGFADLTRGYTYPDMPGYASMLEYGLAEILAPVKGVEIPRFVAQQAAESMALVQRQNFKLTDLAVDPAWTSNHRGWYNINTGTGG